MVAGIQILIIGLVHYLVLFKIPIIDIIYVWDIGTYKFNWVNMPGNSFTSNLRAGRGAKIILWILEDLEASPQ